MWGSSPERSRSETRPTSGSAAATSPPATTLPRALAAGLRRSTHRASARRGHRGCRGVRSASSGTLSEPSSNAVVAASRLQSVRTPSRANRFSVPARRDDVAVPLLVSRDHVRHVRLLEPCGLVVGEGQRLGGQGVLDVLEPWLRRRSVRLCPDGRGARPARPGRSGRSARPRPRAGDRRRRSRPRGRRASRRTGRSRPGREALAGTGAVAGEETGASGLHGRTATPWSTHSGIISRLLLAVDEVGRGSAWRRTGSPVALGGPCASRTATRTCCSPRCTEPYRPSRRRAGRPSSPRSAWSGRSGRYGRGGHRPSRAASAWRRSTSITCLRDSPPAVLARASSGRAPSSRSRAPRARASLGRPGP